MTGSWIPFNRPEMYLLCSGLFGDTLSFCQPSNVRHGRVSPEEAAVCSFYPNPSPHQVQGSMNQRWKEKAFRVILEEPGRATLRPPVLKHKKGRERVGRWIFHLPFFWVWVQQFTPEKAVWIKLRWWAFGCHGNYSAVCSRLMLL